MIELLESVTVEFLGEPLSAIAPRIITTASMTCKNCGKRIACTTFNGRVLFEHIPHRGPWPNTHCPWEKGHVCKGDSCRNRHATPLIGTEVNHDAR